MFLSVVCLFLKFALPSAMRLEMSYSSSLSAQNSLSWAQEGTAAEGWNQQEQRDDWWDPGILFFPESWCKSHQQKPNWNIFQFRNRWATRSSLEFVSFRKQILKESCSRKLSILSSCDTTWCLILMQLGQINSPLWDSYDSYQIKTSLLQEQGLIFPQHLVALRFYHHIVPGSLHVRKR